jgi:hypothetical protein
MENAKFVQGEMSEVIAENPQAAKIVKVCGGYMVFATIAAYKTWRAQK